MLLKLETQMLSILEPEPRNAASRLISFLVSQVPGGPSHITCPNSFSCLALIVIPALVIQFPS